MHLLRLAGRPRACFAETRRARQGDCSVSGQLKLVRRDGRSRLSRVTHWIALALVALTLVGACTQTSLPPIVEPQRVFVIVMENHSYEEALQGSYTAELEKQAGVATNYHAITHPSVPNYLAITSGDTWGIDGDIYRALPPHDIGHQLTSAHIRSRAYMEGLGPGGCFDSARPYDGDHNPFAYYGGRCPDNVVPFSELSQDLISTATRFSWIGPDICPDQHHSSIAVRDGRLPEPGG